MNPPEADKWLAVCGLVQPPMKTTSLPTYKDADLAKLSVSELIDLLIRDEDRVPLNVIHECARRGEAMLEALTSKFSDANAWRRDLPLGCWWLRLHAAMIFGLMPAGAAASALVDWMQRSTMDGSFDDFEEWFAGYWPALFRNKADGAQRELRALCEDRRLDWYTRAVAIDVTVFISARAGSERLEAELARLALFAADADEDWDFRFAMGHALLQFPRARYRPIIESLALAEAYGAIEDACDFAMSLDIADVEGAYARGTDEPEWLRWEDPWSFYATAAIAARELRWQQRPPNSRETAPASASHDRRPGNRRRHNRRGRRPH